MHDKKKYISMIVCVGGGFGVNTTFNNISVVSWRSVLLVGKPEYPEITTDLPQFTDKPYHIMMCRVHLARVGFKPATLAVLCTNCIGNCQSNYHTITTTASPMIVCNGIYLTKCQI